MRKKWRAYNLERSKTIFSVDMIPCMKKKSTTKLLILINKFSTRLIDKSVVLLHTWKEESEKRTEKTIAPLIEWKIIKC